MLCANHGRHAQRLAVEGSGSRRRTRRGEEEFRASSAATSGARSAERDLDGSRFKLRSLRVELGPKSASVSLDEGGQELEGGLSELTSSMPPGRLDAVFELRRWMCARAYLLELYLDRMRQRASAPESAIYSRYRARAGLPSFEPVAGRVN